MRRPALAQSMAPDIELPEGAGAQPEPESVVAVRSAQQTGTAWSVTVAAQYADGAVRYFAIPVVADSGDASFTVSGDGRPGARRGSNLAVHGDRPGRRRSVGHGRGVPRRVSDGRRVRSTAIPLPAWNCRPSPPPRTRHSPSSRSSPPTRKRPPSPSPQTERGRARVMVQVEARETRRTVDGGYAATGCGPADFSGQGGSSGSISAHMSSSTIHGRVLTSSRTEESSHRSRRTRALQQDQVTSS
ncbi:hypothetical protein QF035_010316 [Streptomyces umbrinus]|uniref:Uncharacterized protein n=1 Tax=Streptomyces umbrinus TaxID=67370 RepID=A0ABU0TA96_9ACTN|nr:hypothetical protein [Streptomyces umbrinus]